MDKDIFIEEYRLGLTIRDISKKHGVSYETVRKALKGAIPWRRKYLSDFTEEQVKKALDMFDNKKSVKEIANWFEISAPAISRLLKAYNREPDSSAKRYEILRATPLNLVQKQFLIGHLLGDGCLYRDGKNSLYKVSLSQKKDHEQYFHWKRVLLDPFVNAWRENRDKRGNSVMLNATSICHPDFKQFADMFYTSARIKIVPKNLDMFVAPLSLAVWVMDDGNLNAGVNMRIATMGFSHDDQLELQSLLKRSFDIRSKIMKFRYKSKVYEQLTLNKRNTQILSDLVRPHIIDCMRYKIMPESPTTNTPNSEKR